MVREKDAVVGFQVTLAEGVTKARIEISPGSNDNTLTVHHILLPQQQCCCFLKTLSKVYMLADYSHIHLKCLVRLVSKKLCTPSSLPSQLCSLGEGVGSRFGRSSGNKITLQTSLGGILVVCHINFDG
ncbi:hypothetical protein [Rivularia sp. UHCC 0363]|uniref:hypothetical protein n=1 Tax=Rivularia sp. UHCC 0363 TaxID=3110244 RepID=UPI002B2199A4|nr:hypothetical protein [Rivularia sp. UHCC 0363]MEA5598215.1 hypothetical protein [Rivularia sp. UHCC 0363]